jgi:hypothetical protein
MQGKSGIEIKRPWLLGKRRFGRTGVVGTRERPAVGTVLALGHGRVWLAGPMGTLQLFISGPRAVPSPLCARLLVSFLLIGLIFINVNGTMHPMV